ncbi:15182_t:CDS:2, partial [Dentiscutata heterogama]
PYMPIVHRTFGVGQSETLYMSMIQNIKVFIAEIMARSCGFGHTDYDLQYFGQLFNDLEFMKNLFRTYKKDEDIIKDFIKSFEYDINGTYTVKQKKNQRYKNYATNLLLSFKKINNENERKEFFINAKFPISTLYNQDIDPIINEFFKKKVFCVIA